MKTIDFKAIDGAERYQWLISAIVPRPIAWISTINKQGQTNLAPFSFFMAVSSSPPTLAISITPKRDGSPKDTLKNLRETGECVVHVSTLASLQAIGASAQDLPYGESEIDHLKLATSPSLHVRSPRVMSSPIQMECKLVKEVTIGEGLGSSSVAFVEILCMHVKQELVSDAPNPRFQDSTISVDKLEPLSRLGGKEWGATIAPSSS